MIKHLDHVILATNDVTAAAQRWLKAFGLKTDTPYTPDGSHLELAKLLLASGAFLELVRPTNGGHRVAKFITDHGEGMFSISLLVDDLDATVADLRARNLRVSDPEPGAWPGTRLARIPRASAHGVAIQLIERSS